MTKQILSHPKLKRKKKRLLGDSSRVIARLHMPDGAHRISKIIQRIVDLPDTTAADLLAQIMIDFSERHRDIKRVLGRHMNEVRDYASGSRAQRDQKSFHRGLFYHGVLH